jgi:hypothetical protein
MFMKLEQQQALTITSSMTLGDWIRFDSIRFIHRQLLRFDRFVVLRNKVSSSKYFEVLRIL